MKLLSNWAFKQKRIHLKIVTRHRVAVLQTAAKTPVHVMHESEHNVQVLGCPETNFTNLKVTEMPQSNSLFYELIRAVFTG